MLRPHVAVPLIRFGTSTLIPDQAVDRLDESAENPKMEGQSAAICNQALAGQVGEERFQLEALENTGAA